MPLDATGATETAASVDRFFFLFHSCFHGPKINIIYHMLTVNMLLQHISRPEKDFVKGILVNLQGIIRAVPQCHMNQNTLEVPVLNALPEEDIQRYAPAADVSTTTSVKGAAQFLTPKFQEHMKSSKG